MATASGPAAAGFIAADFYHAPSGVRYRIYEEGGKVWLSYELPSQVSESEAPGAAGNAGPLRQAQGRLSTRPLRGLAKDDGSKGGSAASFAQDGHSSQVPKSEGPGAPGVWAPGSSSLSGRRELIYYLGSGLRGRTYLFEQDGYWFEAPINWYAKKKVWDMAPAFQDAREMPLTLAVDPGCLHCHASGVATAMPEARNQYAGAPFAEGGITCAACHGDGAAHAATGGKVKMLDLDRLPAVRRDSICLNCHLEGQVGVTRPGRRPEDFRPGDDLFDYSVFFVHKGENGSGGRATSQWEALLRSQCKIVSGDKLTCTTCHDPHGGPAAQGRVAYYRGKCLQCHAGMAKGHHEGNADCTECHMARPPSNDIAHEQVTDHWIRKTVSEAPLPRATTGELESVGGVKASDRDLGLAYAQLAAQGDREAGKRALELLRKAEAEPGADRDHEVHAELGFLLEVSGNSAGAAAEYGQALAADAYDELARGNLALIEARGGKYAEAMRDWGTVFENDPAALEAGFNLTVVECAAGQRGAALGTLERILEFSPGDKRAAEMAAAIRGGKECGGNGK